MNTYASSVEPERKEQLHVARELYKSLLARYPDRLIILCDDRGLMLARTDRDAATGSLLSEH